VKSFDGPLLRRRVVAFMVAREQVDKIFEDCL